jgi:hypothetical protein
MRIAPRAIGRGTRFAALLHRPCPVAYDLIRNDPGARAPGQNRHCW